MSRGCGPAGISGVPNAKNPPPTATPASSRSLVAVLEDEVRDLTHPLENPTSGVTKDRAFVFEASISLANLLLSRLHAKAGEPALADAYALKGIILAGRAGSGRLRAHAAGSRIDAAFDVLAREQTEPWPLIHRAHRKDLTLAMVHIARARLAVIVKNVPGARARLADARTVLKRIGREETLLVRLRLVAALRALDDADRVLCGDAPKAA